MYSNEQLKSWELIKHRIKMCIVNEHWTGDNNTDVDLMKYGLKWIDDLINSNDDIDTNLYVIKFKDPFNNGKFAMAVAVWHENYWEVASNGYMESFKINNSDVVGIQRVTLR